MGGATTDDPPVSPLTPEPPDPYDYDRVEDAYIEQILGRPDPSPGA